jgi:osmotically-inducible protein OsmY
MARTDQAIKKDLVDELFWDYRVDASDVKVEVSEGRITLTGTVPSYAALRAAEDAAWNVDSVGEVSNLLTVDFPQVVTVPTDAEIETSAEKTLAWNPEVYSLDIDITVINGKIKLEGTVDSYWKRWKVENLVSDLKGVTAVENLLAVTPGDDILDRDIARNVEAALVRNQYVDADQIAVEVEDGKVTLSGPVPSKYARTRAYNAAAFSPGVVEVENDTFVTPVIGESRTA